MSENAQTWSNCLRDINNGISVHGTGMINIGKLAKVIMNKNIVINSIDLPEILNWSKCFNLICKDFSKGALSLKQLKRRIGYKLLNVSNENELKLKVSQLININAVQYLRIKSDALVNAKECQLITEILNKNKNLSLAVEIDENAHINLIEYAKLLKNLGEMFEHRVFVSYDTGHFFNFQRKLNIETQNLIEQLSACKLKVAVIEINQIGKASNMGWHRIPWEDGKIDILDTIEKLKKSQLLVDEKDLEIVTEIYPWFFPELTKGMYKFAQKIFEIIK
ncbi:MAG TPA: hypothetical protein PLZ62_00555 [bacterium]|nr:hypothetical protein [bacterium]